MAEAAGGLLQAPPGAMMPPHFEASLTAGMPTPADIVQQKEAFARGIDMHFRQGQDVLNDQHKQSAEYLKRQAEHRKQQFLLSVDQQLRQDELQLNQTYNEQLMALHKASQMQRAELEQQASNLALEYNTRKNQEEFLKQQHSTQKAQYEAQMKLMAELGLPPGAPFPPIGAPPIPVPSLGMLTSSGTAGQVGAGAPQPGSAAASSMQNGMMVGPPSLPAGLPFQSSQVAQPSFSSMAPPPVSGMPSAELASVPVPGAGLLPGPGRQPGLAASVGLQSGQLVPPAFAQSVPQGQPPSGQVQAYSGSAPPPPYQLQSGLNGAMSSSAASLGMIQAPSLSLGGAGVLRSSPGASQLQAAPDISAQQLLPSMANGGDPRTVMPGQVLPVTRTIGGPPPTSGSVVQSSRPPLTTMLPGGGTQVETRRLEPIVVQSEETTIRCVCGVAFVGGEVICRNCGRQRPEQLSKQL